jgi:hypothetical protein
LVKPIVAISRAVTDLQSERVKRIGTGTCGGVNPTSDVHANGHFAPIAVAHSNANRGTDS